MLALGRSIGLLARDYQTTYDLRKFMPASMPSMGMRRLVDTFHGLG